MAVFTRDQQGERWLGFGTIEAHDRDWWRVRIGPNITDVHNLRASQIVGEPAVGLRGPMTFRTSASSHLPHLYLDPARYPRCVRMHITEMEG